MNSISDIIEAAISDGFVTTELDSRTLVKNDDRKVEIDWDAYPHSLELV